MSLRDRMFGAAAVGLLVMVLGGLSSLSSMRQLERSMFWVRHSDAVIEELSSVVGLLIDVETGSRGFALSGQADFLEPYQAAKPRLPSCLERLRRMTLDSPAQQARLRELDGLVSERIALADALVDARRAGGLEAASAIVPLRRGKATMDEARGVINAMGNEERGLLQQRVRADRAAVIWTYVTVGSMSLLGLLVVGIGSILFEQSVLCPIRHLLRGVQRVASGDFGFQIEHGRRDELGKVADAFNDMVVKRRHAEERNRVLVDEVRDYAIYIVDPEGRIASWNRGGTQMFGYEAGDVLGQHLSLLFPPGSAVRARCSARRRRKGARSTRAGAFAGTARGSGLAAWSPRSGTPRAPRSGSPKSRRT